MPEPSFSQAMLTDRGFPSATPASIESSVRAVLETMPTALYGQAGEELSEAEREVLMEGGLDLARTPGSDPLAAPLAIFAALVSTSLDPRGVAERLGVLPDQVRQMIARRTLYSVKLDDRRYVPLFQFCRSGPLVTNIAQVNSALPADLRPVSVYGWYTRADQDLGLEENDEGPGMTPLEWLCSGGDPRVLVRIARRL